MDIPRTALITWCPPDIRYAGGEFLRKAVRRLPPDRIRWCALSGSPQWSPEAGAAGRVFAGRPLHWRLKDTSLAHGYRDAVEAPRLARAIARWLEPFRPELLWVLPELASVSVGLSLARITGLPVHVTLHDAHEQAVHAGVPRLYARAYLRGVRRLLRTAASLDGISAELLDHVRREFGLPPATPAVVFPPSVDPELAAPPRAAPAWQGEVRTIGLCGSFRVSPAQWAAFLAALGRLPQRIDLLAFSPREDAPDCARPPNVSVRWMPYAGSEAEVIRGLAGADAAYLGLWREPERTLFARTSLSSKLAAYAAAGLPVIFDGPPDSVAWRTIETYRAGILLPGDVEAAGTALTSLLDDAGQWARLAAGAGRLCAAEFDMDRNIERFAARLRETAAGKVRKEGAAP